MYKIYNTDLQTNRIKEINEFEKGSWINIVSPTDKEISLICEKLGIEEEYLKYPLDLEEKARIDSDDKGNLITYGLITASSENNIARIQKIQNKLIDLIKEYKIEKLIAEDVHPEAYGYSDTARLLMWL